MKLINAKYNLTVTMQENKADILVIENPSVMTEIVGGLQMQCDGEEGDFVLFENDKILKIEKSLALVMNPFTLDFNDKKILNKLYSELKIIGNDYFLEKEEINTKIIQLLEKVMSSSQYNNIAFNLSLEWDTLFKLYSVKLEQNCETLLEKLIEYMKILSRLCSINILCLVNIKSFFDEVQIKQLYEMAFYNKIQLLLIENMDRPYIDNENTYIIDKDKCLIIK